MKIHILPIILASGNLATKECVYVESPAITITDNVARLVFSLNEDSLDIESREKWEEEMRAASEKYTEVKTTIMIGDWMDKDPLGELSRQEEFAKVTGLQIELHTTCTGDLLHTNRQIRTKNRCWTGLVPVISKICRDLFPHFAIEASSFILFFADGKQYSCKKNLKTTNTNLCASLIRGT